MVLGEKISRYSHINQSLPGTNFGTSANMSVGDDASAATKWDITAIPSGSIVQSATITVDIAGDAAGVCDFYETKRKWVETEATWNSYSTGNSWETGGAQRALDKGATVVGSFDARPPAGERTLALTPSCARNKPAQTRCTAITGRRPPDANHHWRRMAVGRNPSPDAHPAHIVANLSSLILVMFRVLEGTTQFAG